MTDVRRRITGDGSIAGVNIVPVIDLCLVLLVILLIISPMLDKAPIEVALPKARAAEEQETSIAVTLAPDGRLAVNDRMVDDQAQLGEYLKRVVAKDQGPNVLVIIRSDESVSYGALTALIKVVTGAGFNNIAVGTEQVREEKNKGGRP